MDQADAIELVDTLADLIQATGSSERIVNEVLLLHRVPGGFKI